MSNPTSPTTNGGPIRHKRKSFVPPPFEQRKGIRCVQYCFVWNNYPEDAQEKIQREMMDKRNALWCINSEEVGPECGTPHLQGYVLFKSKIHWVSLENSFPGVMFIPAKAKDKKAQWVYIRKGEEEADFAFYEYGTRPEFGLNEAQKERNQSAADRNREMWADAYEAAKEGRFDDIPPNLLIPHLRNFKQVYQDQRSQVAPMENVQLRPWQSQLMDMLAAEPDSRKIYWYWEETGNVGKSWMATFLLRNHNATVLSSGKNADIAYLLDQPRIVVFDISRDHMEHVNFGVMEDIKNGRIFSPKYESRIKAFDVPHLVVFANEPCPFGKFSSDRIMDINLTERMRNLEQDSIPRPVLRRTDPIVAIVGDNDYVNDYHNASPRYEPLSPLDLGSLWSPPIQQQISEEENRENIRKWINEFEGVDENTRPCLGSFVRGFNIPK
nr:MAG: replication associated protein [Arizlama virus]